MSSEAMRPELGPAIAVVEVASCALAIADIQDGKGDDMAGSPRQKYSSSILPETSLGRES